MNIKNLLQENYWSNFFPSPREYDYVYELWLFRK